jgi:hypothetical protein
MRAKTVAAVFQERGAAGAAHAGGMGMTLLFFRLNLSGADHEGCEATLTAKSTSWRAA